MSVDTVARAAALDPLDAVGAFETVLDGLDDTALSLLSDADLRSVMHRLERVQRRLGVASHSVVSEIASRGSHVGWGYMLAGDMLSQELHISRGEAARRLRVAAAITPLTGLTGAVCEPTHPEIADAMGDGAISDHHADTVLSVLDKIPAAVDEQTRELAEATLVESAKQLTPLDLSRVGDRLLARVDPDGTLTDDRDRNKRRGLSLGRQDAQLMSKLSAELDPKTRAMLDVLLDTWATPGMNNPDDPESPAGSYSDPGTDRDQADAAAERDTRSAPQRRHDAFSAMLGWFIESGTLGSHRGSPAQVVATMTLTELEKLVGVATTMSGGDIPVADAVELAKKKSALIAVLDPQEVPLYLGRTHRLASAAQRIAESLRDRGCTHPGCSVPPSWTQSHHGTDWAKGGLTDIDQLVQACPEHHAMVGDGPERWQTVIVQHGPYRGRCGWIPPAAIDPDRQPRINHLHHPDELLAQAWERISTRPRSPDPWTN
ncbi:DUF222 domain-containing protein [Williamsia sp. M5A3_1d]